MSESIALTKVAGLLRSGLSLDQALEHLGEAHQHSKGLAYLIDVASHSGSPVAEDIDFVAELMSSRERSINRIQIAHASPKSTARLMLWLPIITLGMAELLGWGVFASINEKPIVLLSLVLGLSLLLASKFITSRLLNKAAPQDSYEGFYLVAVALLFSSGTGLASAQEQALANYIKFFCSEPSSAELIEMQQVTALVEQTGARASSLLRKQALAMQAKVDLAREIKIEKLGIKLMLPLGLGVLPAFVLLAIVPLMVTTLGSK
jgi:tight adherence protein B